MAKTKNWSRENLAWVSGLLEGEGCFLLHEQRPKIAIGMSDPDVLAKLHEIVGYGNLRGPYAPGKRGIKQMYRWESIRAEEAHALMVAVWPWMGQRRQEKISEVLKVWYSNKRVPNGRKTHCKHGHEFSKENTLVTTTKRGYATRQCRACRKDR